jgi:hypothetical protein
MLLVEVEGIGSDDADIVEDGSTALARTWSALGGIMSAAI